LRAVERARLAKFEEVFNKTKAAAALAAGVFHRQEVEIKDVKQHMEGAEIPAVAIISIKCLQSRG
jgi:imidazole glycerol phosphate synthase subunit HisF